MTATLLEPQVQGRSELPVNEIVCGNVLEVLQSFPSESVDMVITSPPYWGLRNYGTPPQVWDEDPDCEHQWKTSHGLRPENGTFCTRCTAWRGSLGLEPTLDLFLQHLCGIFDEIKRVLKKTGTCWVNLGDTYSGSNCGYGDTKGKERYRKGRGLQDIKRGYFASSTARPPSAKTRLAAKSLCLIPARFAVEMVERGWILRNRIIWHKPNCMPSSAKDRFTVDFEEVFFFARQGQYYFETQYEPYTQPMNRWGGKTLKAEGESSWDKGTGQNAYRRRKMRPDPRGRNKRSIWSIPTQPFPEAHFAVYPPRLIEVPIRAGCPEFVCKKCGAPREKVFKGKSGSAFNIRVRDVKKGRIKHSDRKASRQETESYNEKRYRGDGKRFAGYRDGCSCNAGFEPGIILDPFMGSGTTALVALEHNRRFVGIELKREYVRMAHQRIREVANNPRRSGSKR